MKRIFQKEYKWLRVVLFAGLFMLLPTALDNGWNGYWRYYYQTANIEEFYEPVEMFAENICLGDLTQDVQSIRHVRGTETGWQADIVRELDRNDSNGLFKKVWEESANVFIEKVPDGKVNREAALPRLQEGVYQWRITVVKLYLPYGVERVVSPSLTSNNFAVEKCGDS